MSDIRNQLVTLYRNSEMTKYDEITQMIIRNYRAVVSNKDFFHHLKNQIKIKYKKGEPVIDSTTFSENTLLCLERCLTQLQEDGIPESMSYLYVITKLH